MSFPSSFIKEALPSCEIQGEAFLSKYPEIKQFVTDSRHNLIGGDTAFIALKTGSGDGHNFLAETARKGVRIFIVQTDDSLDFLPEDAVIVRVPDTMKALRDLAKFHRTRIKGRMLAVTGSTGKTMFKEMLYASLFPFKNISRTPGSFNSLTGVPLGLLQLDEEAEICVAEAGIDGIGQMLLHGDIIRPEIGVLTRITDEHESGFSSKREKILEKISLFQDCSDIFALDNDILSKEILQEKYGCKNLHFVKAENSATEKYLARAVAAFLCENDSFPAENISEPVSTLTEVDEGLRNSVILRDNFTSDLSSILQSVDNLSMRGRRDNPLKLIMKEPALTRICHEDILKILEACSRVGIAKITGIGKIFVAMKSECLAASHGMEFQAYENEKECIGSIRDEDISECMIMLRGSWKDDLANIRNRLLPSRHDTVMKVNLDNLLHNFRYFRSLCSPSTKFIAMVKASAYGMGALEVARSLQSTGAAYLAVAVIEEGVALRKGGISMPVMVLNPITSNFSELFSYGLEPAIFSIRELNTIIKEVQKFNPDKAWPIHIKLDTGMHRLGFLPDEIEELAETLKNNSRYVKATTVFSHLATADCLDKDLYTFAQVNSFDSMTADLKNRLPYPFKRHLLNTAGIMRYGKEIIYDFARLGIGLYGISPLAEKDNEIYPVASLESTIISLRTLHIDEKVGYGCKGCANSEPTVIATVPIGYADGIDRHYGCGNATFIVNGVKCPTIGNICMDLCMIDVTKAKASLGDTVEIFNDSDSVVSLAETRGTIPYEVLTSVSPRVKRIYSF